MYIIPRQIAIGTKGRIKLRQKNNVNEDFSEYGINLIYLSECASITQELAKAFVFFMRASADINGVGFHQIPHIRYPLITGFGVCSFAVQSKTSD